MQAMIAFIAAASILTPAGVSVAGFSFLLACIHVVLGLGWFALLIAATRALGRRLARYWSASG